MRLIRWVGAGFITLVGLRNGPAKAVFSFCVLFAISSAWSTSITIIESRGQPVQVSYSGFSSSTSLTPNDVWAGAFTLDGFISGPFYDVPPFGYFVWLMERGGVRDLGNDLLTGLVNDQLELVISPVYNDPGICPPDIHGPCQQITLWFYSFDPAIDWYLHVPGWGRFTFLQDTGELQDLSGCVGGVPLYVQSPVPEPSALSLLCAAAFGLPWCLRRKPAS